MIRMHLRLRGATAVLALLAVALAAPTALARPGQAARYCGLVDVHRHHYALLATGVPCSLARTTALRLAPLQPKPFAAGSRTGSLRGGPKGFVCFGTLGPGNVQINGGCTAAGKQIQWTRAT